MEKEISFIINRSEITAGTRGASLGPDAIFTAARKNNNNFFGGFKIIELPSENYLLDQPLNHPFAKRIEGLCKVYESISNTIESELKDGNFPIVLAGDHGSAGGSIAGIKKTFPDKRLGVVWIDAHADLHTPYTTPSGNMHGMPLSTALNDDNLVCKINEVPSETVLLWEKLKNIGYHGPKVQAKDLFFIAVRDTEAEENEIIKRLGIKNYPVAEVIEKGASVIVESILAQLEGCDMIYISFDVDSMDPEITSYGTGTPVKNGLSPEQANELLIGFGKSSKVIGFEFVEVNPCLDDKKNKMAEITFDLIESLVNTIKK